VGSDEDYSQRLARGIIRGALRGQHHGHVYIAGKVSQPLSVTWIGEAGKMESVLVSRRGDDGIDFAGEGELYRRLDGVACDTPRPDETIAVWVRVAAAQTPGAHGDFPLGRNRVNLVFRSDYCNLCVDGLSQSARCDLGTDSAGVAQAQRQTRPPALRPRPSRLSPPSPQDLIST
jgi:hypothetical protein